MVPSDFVRNKKWFIKPWTVKKQDPKHFAYSPMKVSMVGEDGDCEVLQHMQDLEESFENEQGVCCTPCKCLLFDTFLSMKKTI